MEYLNWVGEHPILTVVILYVVIQGGGSVLLGLFGRAEPTKEGEPRG